MIECLGLTLKRMGWPFPRKCHSTMRLFHAFSLVLVFQEYLSAFTLKRLKPVTETVREDTPVFLFDLDGTLYSGEDAARSNHQEILLELLQTQKGFSLREAEAELKRIRTEYHNVPELGIVLKEGIDGRILEKWNHDKLSLYGLLKPDDAMKALLSHMNIPKFVFTNSGM